MVTRRLLLVLVLFSLLLIRRFVGRSFVGLLVCVFLPPGVLPSASPVGGLVFPVGVLPFTVRGAVFAFSSALLVFTLTLVLNTALMTFVGFPGSQTEGLRDSEFTDDVASGALVIFF